MSKAHHMAVNLVPAKTRFVLWLSCPSGCVTGYLYGTDPEMVRGAAEAVVDEHLISYGGRPSGPALHAQDEW